MEKPIEIAEDTQRTIQGLASCSGLLDRLTAFLSRLLRHPEQESPDAIASAMESALDKLLAVEQRLRASLSASEEDDTRAGRLRDLPGQCVLRGVSPAVPIASVLAFMSANHKTGTLRICTRRENFTLEIVDGDVVHAYSDRPPAGERLGDILVARGHLDAETLEAFLQKYASSSVRMGEALEQEELVSMEAMRSALEHQTQRLFHRIFTAEESLFYFFRGDTILPELQIRMKMIQLLLESARTQDEDEAAEAEAGRDDPSGDEGGTDASPPD